MIAGPVELPGRYGTLVQISAAHTDSLWNALADPDTHHVWDYLAEGPYLDRDEFARSIERKAASADPFFLAILDGSSGHAVGHAAYMRMEPKHRVVEVGHVLFTPGLQRSTLATEAMYLMARHAFEDLEIRRYEWKCNALNLPSRRAAERLGFTYEGTFRQHMIVKERNRDTAWFSMLDAEWPARKIEYERWLHPSNFDAHGTQLTRLSH